MVRAMHIALIRHGQTDWNLQGLMQGRSDIPLNETGREQARVAASALSSEPWDAVVSSPLVRARETAELIGSALRVPLGASYDELIEQEFGEAEGVPVADLGARWPDRDFEGKEPDEAVGPRGIRALERVASEHADSRVLVVTHAMVIRHTLAAISGHAERRYPKLENASSSYVRFTDASWRVITVGGVAFSDVLPGLGDPIDALRPAV